MFVTGGGVARLGVSLVDSKTRLRAAVTACVLGALLEGCTLLIHRDSLSSENFGPDQPVSDPERRCVQLHDSTGFWSNAPCSDDLQFICGRQRIGYWVCARTRAS
jgi:hypothetical protein